MPKPKAKSPAQSSEIRKHYYLDRYVIIAPGRNLRPDSFSHQGDAHKIVPTLEGPFDFVLLDADKQGQVDYFKKLFPTKLTPGALLVAHNAIELKDMMEDYLKLIGNHPEFETVILSLTMQDGFAVSYRSRKPAG